MATIDARAGLAMAATSIGFHRSTDGGVNWVRGGRGLPDRDFTSLAFGPDGAPMYLSEFADGGVYRSGR